ncbi:MAG: helix-turn-helix transcriptional regulator [Bacteroidales bacterium]|nr:helix-turn-helix transcriptional regulator [Bacteroidales bacterium]
MQNDFFHINLRRARERAGLSQAELADEIGVGRTTIVSLESGRTRLFNKTVSLIAKRLGVSDEALLCGREVEELLREEPSRIEREQAIRDEYEQRLDTLREKLEAEQRLNKVLQGNVDSLTQSNQYLLSQLRKEQ